MSSGMPELGSKISLISKADIRYEGRLFTVDPQECTIALASVRSFGTEDRETQYPVAPQNQVYDYILFRGSDIKDIRVVNNVPSMPNDPAIMQLSMPASLGSGPPQGGYQQPQFSHPVVGPTPYPAYHPMAGLPGGLRPAMQPLSKQPSELPSTQQPPPPIAANLSQPPPQPHKDQGSMLEMIGGGSRSETPVTRKSPTVEQGTQMGPPQLQQGAGPSGGPQQNHMQGNQQNRNNNNRMQNNNNRNQQNNRPRSQNRNNIQSNNLNQPQHHQQHQQHHPNQMQNHQNMNQQGHHQNMNQHQQGHHQGGMRQNWGRGRGGGGGNMRGGRGGGYSNNRGGYTNNRGGNKKNTLKFENDYDFEQANTEFEELRSQLSKVKIAEGETKPENETEKKDDSGNETGAGEPEPEEDVTCYDKNKSFFDNISCEAVERSKGRSQRTDWRTERKLNSETFGVATARRGAYRGRGYWGGRGGQQGGGGGGGGGWGGWRGGQNRQHQHRNNPRHNQNQPQPHQQTPQPLPSK